MVIPIYLFKAASFIPIERVFAAALFKVQPLITIGICWLATPLVFISLEDYLMNLAKKPGQTKLYLLPIGKTTNE